MSRRPRPLLALASLVPLGLALGVAAQSPAPEPAAISRAQAQASAPDAALLCAGPLTVPEELLQGGADAGIAVVPPAGTASTRGIALDGDSSLLFGQVSANETLTAPGGAPRAPALQAQADGADVPGATIASGAYGDTVTGVLDVAEPTTVTASPSGDHGVVADAVQSTATLSGDFRSLALTRCAAPVSQASFLGARTTPGSSAALVLANPSDRPATASLQITTPTGPADMGGRSRVVVAPGQTQTVLLESIAPGQEALGVDVTTVGAPLAMHLQVTERDGLTPRGAEIQSPLAPADAEQVVPGVHVVEGRAPEVLIHNPGREAVPATVELLGAEGPVADAAPEDVTVPAGSVVAVPLASAPVGDLAVRVRADAPLSSVVRTGVVGADLPGDTIGAPVDLALPGAAQPLPGAGLLALPPKGPDGALSLVADQTGAVTVIPVGADGQAGTPLERELGAGAAVSVPSSDLAGTDGPPAALLVVPDNPSSVHGAWVQAPAPPEAGGPLLSTVTVPAGAQGADALSVTLR